MEEKKNRDEDTLNNSTGTSNPVNNTVNNTKTDREENADFIDATEQNITPDSGEGVKTNNADNPTGSPLDVDSGSTDSSSKVKVYAIATLVVLLIAFGLLFVLEKDGRVNTGLFAGITTQMQENEPAAKVNGVTVPMSEFNNGVKQLVEIARLQGTDTESEDAMSQFRSQAIETLINGELLRQEAVDKGITVDESEVDARYAKISEGVGGAEVLEERMAEFGINEEALRQDIEDEILIQGLFTSVFDENEAEVTDEEVAAFYQQSGGEEAGLPPLEEVKEQIVQQIKADKQNQKINSYVQELRNGADIEVLI